MATMTVGEMKARITVKAAEDGDYRAKLIADPKSVISAEFDVQIPAGFDIVVHEDDSTTAHLVLPISDSLTEEELAKVAGGVDVNWDTVNIS